MNSVAFRRAEALENLESYARVIAIYLASMEWFPEHDATAYWQAELYTRIYLQTLKN